LKAGAGHAAEGAGHFTGSTDWSPDQAEHYIDWRIQCIDTDIARLRQQLDTSLPRASAG